jgi:CubicO group peptidase (beta-lactamase class C family)
MVRSTLLVLLCGTYLAGCKTEDPTSGIPPGIAEALDPAYAAAVDSGRVAAREHMASQNLPSVSVAVGRAGHLVWSESFGWADLSRQVLATPTTLYPVGSISKSLTATAAGILHERGMLDFDAPIQTYVPEFPEKRWPVSTAQLMGHIAGVHNYGADDALREGGHCPGPRAGLAVIADDTLLWRPGERYRYSNYGFRLVGAVVEAAAGEPFLEFMDREVFDAMGMERSVPDLGEQTDPSRSTFYARGGFATLRHAQPIDMSCAMAEGGFLSTPTELIRFGFAMLDAEILSRETVDLFWRPQRLASGAPTSYGYGWQVSRITLGNDEDPTPMVGHGGSVVGGRASLLIFPEEDMVVVSMTNTSADVSFLSRRLATFFRDTPQG